MALFFERMGVVNEQTKGQQTNEHEGKRFRSGAAPRLRLSEVQTIARLVIFHFTRYRRGAFGVA